MPRLAISIEESFMGYVEADLETGCWFWRGYINEYGYGKFRNRPAHVVAYELFVGPVPDGLELGHTCENKCANWEHVRPITHLQNVREGKAVGDKGKTHCPQGHEYVPDNMYINPKGYKVCRTCMREKCKEWYYGQARSRILPERS